MRDLTKDALEGELVDEQVGQLLVATDFTEGDCSRVVTMGFLVPSRMTFGVAGG